MADTGGVPLVPRNPPFCRFCVRASPASCARTSAVENILDSGTPFQNPRSATECGYILLGNQLTVSLRELDLVATPSNRSTAFDSRRYNATSYIHNE